MTTVDVRVEAVDYATALPDLRRVREAVFIEEQGVPRDLEQDALDPLCHHMIARDADGAPIGTARLTPDHRIGRMAVLSAWRGRGVGEALLRALLAEARQRQWPAVSLHAQVDAERFYARHGFLPEGDRFFEDGIEHQGMRRLLGGTATIAHRAEAVAITTAVIVQARRSLVIYSRALDPGLWDAPPVLDALRRFATHRTGVQVQVLLQDAATPQRALAPLIGLGQRLSSVFAFREVQDPVDLSYTAAFVANDDHGYYHRPLGHRFDGEAGLEHAGRARQLRDEFTQMWERARPVTEFRALGL
ncbi:MULTISPECIES: GNAT family N-acetyltransferase [unclassified Pseudoxanthomonas]|uniref:GNAT family N-acetyltransferase n=1 Tax=unclassified Pseudoxanthomonas TaxID=2645906 RepID=UPI0008ED74A5|nr:MULTISPECIES: GNAT family N-acetyltransferase [unclassified Pseudoxanthomonas]PPJ42596.1 GNAT family N-acetyltransferase [Pseudoxanthomonas sp. KAs_5_3]SFV26794.1 Predicted N-acyltransferase, GNAT family [Pseudoxanthomonas sp. YR558]